ncbi:MAG: DUF4388 domain-containing protein [Bdellovibrionota bacterium]
MQTGKLSSESFPQLLRGISQKRKQGELELSFGENVRTIYFISGKIVEVRDEGVSEIEEVAEILYKSKLISEIPEGLSSYPALYSSIESEVARPVFERAILHRILDKLHEVDLSKGGFYSFSVQMVDVDRDFTPSVSVGAYLLDLVSQDEQEARLSAEVADEKLLASSKSPSSDLKADDLLILESLSNSKNLSELKQATMLSTFTLHKSVLELIDKKYLVLTSKSVEQPSKKIMKESADPKKDFNIDLNNEYLIFAALLIVLSLSLPFIFWGTIWANF